MYTNNASTQRHIYFTIGMSPLGTLQYWKIYNETKTFGFISIYYVKENDSEARSDSFVYN